MPLRSARATAALSLVALLVAGGAAVARAQRPELVLHAYTLEHKPAAEALALITPLLSAQGTIELQPGGNTVVVRDLAAVVERVGAVLRQFDHPARVLRLRIQVVRAGLEGGGDGDPLDPELARRLGELLRYDSYRVSASAGLTAREGERVLYELGDDYRVEFQLGTLVGQVVRLQGFQVTRRRGDEPQRLLLRTHVNLSLDRPMILGLTQNESSRKALLLVLTCRLGAGEER